MIENKTSKEEIQHWDTLLDQYEQNLGLPLYSEALFSDQELQHYLSMSRDVLEKLTPEQCGEIAYRLGQFSFHIQRTINRENARFNWAEETIKEIIANDINNYKGYGYVEKSLQAIKNNSKASSINKIKKYAKQRSDRLCYLANCIKNLSDIIISIQKNKVHHTNK